MIYTFTHILIAKVLMWRKALIQIKRKALKAADIICTARDCSVLVINEYVAE